MHCKYYFYVPCHIGLVLYLAVTSSFCHFSLILFCRHIVLHCFIHLITGSFHCHDLLFFVLFFASRISQHSSQEEDGFVRFVAQTSVVPGLKRLASWPAFCQASVYCQPECVHLYLVSPSEGNLSWPETCTIMGALDSTSSSCTHRV